MKPKFPTKYIAFTQYFNVNHKAVDIANKVTVGNNKYDNTSVYMTHDAKVITNSYASDYGNYIEYEYYEGKDRYVVGDGHFKNKSALKVGQTYKQGTFIATMGSTGNSNAVHDHHRLSKNGTRVNPLDYEYVYPDQVVGTKETAKLMHYTPEPTPTPTPTPTPSGNTTIKSIQNTLNTNYNTGIAVDGYYGTQTKKALVKGLQSELNKQYGARLSVDGIFGTATKSKCLTIGKGAKGNITWLIQAMLYCRGYNTNGVDGVFGNGTYNAIKSFQKNNGLSADGIVGKNTFEKLFK